MIENKLATLAQKINEEQGKICNLLNVSKGVKLENPQTNEEWLVQKAIPYREYGKFAKEYSINLEETKDPRKVAYVVTIYN